MKGTITLENIGKMPVESLNISVTSKDGEGKELTCFTLDSKGGRLIIISADSMKV